MLTPAEESYRA